MGNMVKMTRAVVPEDMDDGEVLEMGSRDVKEGFSKGKGGVYDNVNGNYGERGINFSPLEVMFRTNLNRGGRSKAEGNNGAINWSMAKLSFSSIGLKGP